MKSIGRTPRELTIMTIMSLGHTGLNNTMFLLKKHPSGLCDCGTEDESVEHVIGHRFKYKMLDFLHLASSCILGFLRAPFWPLFCSHYICFLWGPFLPSMGCHFISMLMTPKSIWP